MGKKHKKYKIDQNAIDTPVERGAEASDSVSLNNCPDNEDKPLKLVLKVGPQETGDVFNPQSQTEEKIKHRHKKKKKRKDEKLRGREVTLKESFEGANEKDLGVDIQEKGLYSYAGTIDGGLGMTGDDASDSLHPCDVGDDNDSATALRQCLFYLQKHLQLKDINGFFAYPVTDSIAPGYSNIIHTPMDFSTMDMKIDRNEYGSVIEYKKDFMLMCSNAMIYNRPETVYFKEAKRLNHVGSKLLSKEKLMMLKRSQAWLANLSEEDIGMSENAQVLDEMLVPVEENRPKEKAKSKSMKTVGGPFEAFPDPMSPGEILAEAQEVSRSACEKLSSKRTRNHLVYFKCKKSKVTTLNFLNPDDDGIVGPTERVVDLGELAGEIKDGTGTIAGFKEDKRNWVTPIQYVNYGPFSSFAPQYDSSFASLSREDSDLLLSTYGDETGVQYASSVQSFVDTAGDYAVKMVNNLLDMLTKGQHSRTNHSLEQRKLLERDRLSATDVGKTSDESSQEIQGDGPCSKSVLEPVSADCVQDKLDSTVDLISNLRQLQEARLSQPTPLHLDLCQQPSDSELVLADSVQHQLVDLAKDVTPGDMVGVETLRAAMGMSSCSSSSQNSPADHDRVNATTQEADAPSAETVSDTADDEEDSLEGCEEGGGKGGMLMEKNVYCNADVEVGTSQEDVADAGERYTDEDDGDDDDEGDTQDSDI